MPTQSSRPHFHPQALKEETVNAIVKLRMKRRRCAEVISRTFKSGCLSEFEQREAHSGASGYYPEAQPLEEMALYLAKTGS